MEEDEDANNGVVIPYEGRKIYYPMTRSDRIKVFLVNAGSIFTQFIP